MEEIAALNLSLDHAQVAEQESCPGQVYFIRHGESTSNERNIFAGIIDVGLTAFGKLQARRAGLDLQKKGIKFDAVYVSHMRRARQTCEIALEVSQALNSPDIPVQIDHRISERSFGIFVGRNLNLLRLALGYEGFEEMLHSHNEAPPTGEKIGQVYKRAADFYQERVVPHLKRGENVLVVCHQYVLEPLAIYLSHLPPSAYHPLKLPNGKALSREELVKFRHSESKGFAAVRKKINDLATMWAIFLYATAFLVGSLLKIGTGITDGIPRMLFGGIIVLCLGISTFYTYLDIDFAASKQKLSRTVQYVVYAWMLVRWAIGLLLIFSGVIYQNTSDLDNILWLMFWMVPPALTSPILSILWGGNLYPAAVLSRLLSIIAPIALVLTFALAQLPINSGNLNFFFVILILGLALPGTAAQWWRSQSPVDSNRYSKEWKFIGVLSVGLMALVTGFQFAPVTLISDIAVPVDTTKSFYCLQQLGFGILTFVLMRGLAALTAKFSEPYLVNKAEAQDIYILLVNPNFFLWAALFTGASANLDNSTIAALQYGIYWASVGFFCIPVLEQLLLLNSFNNNLLRETLRSSKVSTEDVKKLFEQLDQDGNKTLDKSEIMELLGLVEDMTTGERSSEQMRMYITDYLFKILDSDHNGTVDIKELENYVSTYGLIVNLNVAE